MQSFGDCTAIVAGNGISVKTDERRPEYLSDYDPRYERLERVRALGDEVASIFKAGSDPRHIKFSQRMAVCSDCLELAVRYDAEGQKRLKLLRAYFCKVRHCPWCQSRMSIVWGHRMDAALAHLLKEHPKSRWLFLTLTWKNPPVNELRANLKQFSNAWDRMMQRSTLNGLKPNRNGFIQGFARSLEVTRGKDGNAHPHYHVLLMVAPKYFGRAYMRQEEWADLWKEVAELDYTPIIDVRKVKGDDPDNPKRLEALKAGVVELYKYTIKPTDMTADPDFFRELDLQVRRMRARAAGGLIKEALNMQEPSQQEMTEAEDVDATALQEPEEEQRLTSVWQNPRWRVTRKRTVKTLKAV
jgi:plasmid rolling circle replication initiator protein Rep